MRALLPRRTSPYARFIQTQVWKQYRPFAQSCYLRDGEYKYTAPGAEEVPQPKATLRSRFLAVLIGGGIALAYSAYRRQDSSSTATAKVADGFATFTLVDKDAVSSTCTIFTLKPLSSKVAPGAKVNADGGIYSVQLKQPQLQIARSYTLLPPIPGEPIDTLRLLIRKEEKGEVSGYLHDLTIGSDVEVRGPYKDYTFPQDTKKVIFVAGGTGIAPALKTADALKGSDVHVLWASRHREDCAGGVSDTPPSRSIVSMLWSVFASPARDTVAERNTVVLLLDLLKRQNPEKLQVDYFVDDENTHIRPGTVSALLTSEPGNKVIFVSGPEGFIKHWAGAKQFVDGKEQQGRLGGVLSRLDLQGWQVVKL